MRVRGLGVLAFVGVLILLAIPLMTASAPGIVPASGAYMDGIFLVKFRDLSISAIEALNRQFGAQSLGVVSGIGVHRLRVPTGRTVEEMVAAYRGLADVKFAEPDYLAQTADTIPNDVLFRDQWGPAKVRLPAAWDLDKGSSAIVVAVVDTGVDWTHPDLQGRLIPGADLVNRRGNAQDDHGHGTHVAGIIGALTDNGTGVAGANWRVTILPIKVLSSGGFGTYSAIADGIVYAVDHGARIINLSLGGTSPSDTLASAVDYAWGKGAFLACAAGNSNGAILFPAAYRNCTAVAATDQYDQKASFSSYGPQVALAAPGVSILSTVPTGSCYYCDPTGYKYLSGTSMATPHVAGVAALLFDHFSGATNADIRNQMEAQADDLGDVGWDQYSGYGRINAYRAIASPLSPPVPPPPQPATPLSAKIVNPAGGSTVTGWVVITVSITGGLPPYRTTFTLAGKTKAKTLCNSWITSAEAICTWDASKGGPGPYEITIVVSDPWSAARDSITVTVVK